MTLVLVPFSLLRVLCRNDISPIKGIDTPLFIAFRILLDRRNEVSPSKGIDTAMTGDYYFLEKT